MVIPEPDIADWKRGQLKADLIAARVSVARGHEPVAYWQQRVKELEDEKKRLEGVDKSFDFE